MQTSDEDHRRECEARYWLKQTGGVRAEVHDLMDRIEARRGTKAKDELLAEMRRQWGKHE